MGVSAEAAVADAPARRGTRRLVHRLRSWEPLGLAESPDSEEEFVLSDDLPSSHVLLCDGPHRFHDLQAAAEMIREIGEFIGKTHFGVPVDRTGVFYRFAVATRDVSSWRATGTGPAQLTQVLKVRPEKVIAQVPRALEFRTFLQIGDVPCGAGTVNVVFLPPMTHSNHRRHSRAQALRAPARTDVTGAPVDPAEVGRSLPGNVLVHGPCDLSDGRLSVGVRVPAGWPMPGRAAEGHVPALVQLETLRQTSLLAVGRAHGLRPERCTLASLKVHFRGYAEPELGMRCAAVVGLCGRDSEGRRQTPVTLTLTQGGRAVLEAVTTVVEDF
ncbi:AfsA-related hotdog domain-containing protein [Streptomyces beihaiensis]|uniref:AfsA-related hotdog domain-containing protein n=1 Tax=Streptomyces beihaiensis TaxID=2984495 RepID=A0ABT3TWH9_9ACTN|nr:AfsA-related hotdog domain-containing protein [Streptomyces beihaiensis]MCX3061379.1 AfsA-related hotdog domain-containing protein [Streptomyces beihaiensis]